MESGASVSIGKFETPLPESGLVHDYYFQQNGRGRWMPWTDLVKGSEISADRAKDIQNVIVPTMDTARTSYFLDLCVKHQRPLLFVGPTGTG